MEGVGLVVLEDDQSGCSMVDPHGVHSLMGPPWWWIPWMHGLHACFCFRINMLTTILLP